MTGKAPPSAVSPPKPELRATVSARRFAVLPLIRLLRPSQWIHNTFVFAPAAFAGLLLERIAFTQALIAMLIFCIAASAVYLMNDLVDVKMDRAHPIKRIRRPLAAGEVSVPQAITLLAVLHLALAVGLIFTPPIAAGVVTYLGINVAYTFRLKHVPVVDIFCVASGFVLRVWVGAEAVAVPLSPWMLITTLCLALYLTSVKRHQELARNGSVGRSVLDSYSLPLLERYTEISAVGVILFYGLYVTEVSPELVVTMPLVLLGLFRYWFIVEQQGKGESPSDAFWSDVPLALTVVTWAVLSVYVIQAA